MAKLYGIPGTGRLLGKYRFGAASRQLEAIECELARLYYMCMATQTIPEGTVHTLPADFKRALLANANVRALWEDITPLARNEWICWVEEAKKAETRERRIHVGISKLSSGMRRPCCWAGCPHRAKNGKT